MIIPYYKDYRNTNSRIMTEAKDHIVLDRFPGPEDTLFIRFCALSSTEISWYLLIELEDESKRPPHTAKPVRAISQPFIPSSVLQTR